MKPAIVRHKDLTFDVVRKKNHSSVFLLFKKMVKKRELLFVLMLCVQSCFLTVLVSAWSRELPSVFPSFSVLLEYGVVSMDGLCMPCAISNLPKIV